MEEDIEMTVAQDFAGRVAVVTGASSGIGEATGRLLAARGAKVALLARREDRLKALAAELGANALAVPVDVTDRDAAAAAVERVRSELGEVDLVVNNAGVMLPAPIEENRQDEWERMVNLNITGLLRLTGFLVPDLVRAAERGRTADLVNVSSIGAHSVFAGYGVYTASKAFVTHFSANLRAELGPKDVRVTNVEPGLVQTELGDHINHQDSRESLAGWIEDIGETLLPEDVADVIGYVASRPRRINLRQVLVLPTRQV
jgi:NADP-dependent 3-hydroxy acid dehydrogenase YdfG